MYYRVTHNGYDFKFCDTEEEVEQYIKDNLDKEVAHTKIYDEVQAKRRIVIYEYYTLYTEMFLITEE